MRTYILSFCVLLSVTANPLAAQWSKSLSIQTSYDDNAFRNYQGLSDYATQFSGYLARDMSGENWQSRFYYRGNFTLFKDYDERSYHFHQAGAAWSRLFGENGNALNLGMNGGIRINGDTYDYYNYKDASGYANVKLKLAASTTAQFGYRLRGRWYSNIPELTYAEHYLFGRYTRSFQTKTTLILEANYGYKNYRDQVTQEAISDWSMGGYGGHTGGMGHMSGGGWSGGTTSNSIDASVSQWAGQLRLAQSLTNSTGLSTDVLLRRNPGDGVRYLAGQVSGYTTEDELFDDRYGYESEELSATLTQLLPLDMTFKAGLESKWKDYVDRPALDLNGEALSSGAPRQDTQVLWWLSLNKSFRMPGGKSIDIIGEFYWINNNSNDLYYDYQVSLISLGFASSF